MSFMVNYRFTLRVLKYLIQRLKYEIKLVSKMMLMITNKMILAMFVIVTCFKVSQNFEEV